MRRLNYFSVLMCGVILLFASCNKEEDVSFTEEEKTATLAFGAVLNDLMNKDEAMKQAVVQAPGCFDAAPAYVAVVLSGTANVGTIEDPVLVPLNPVPGDFDNDGMDEYFTVESSDLELVPGTYSLDFFAVYDDADNLIWLAPYEGGDLAEWVNALPMEFNLGAGAKKYLDVNVLCFDDRIVHQYGYLFFDIIPAEAVEFCLFGNVCDENGRHVPANFRFDVWTYSGDPVNPRGTALFDENDPYINTVGVNDDGDAYAEPLCLFLPDTAGEDVYHGELYVLENGTSTLIRSGQFTDDEVIDLFEGDEHVDYYHFREGCGQSDSPDLFEAPAGESERM